MKAIQLKSKPVTLITTTTASWTILRRRVNAFINRNGEIFEGLSRQGAPFGGNVAASR